jgi:hypothetical protein
MKIFVTDVRIRAVGRAVVSARFDRALAHQRERVWKIYPQRPPPIITLA